MNKNLLQFLNNTNVNGQLNDFLVSGYVQYWKSQQVLNYKW